MPDPDKRCGTCAHWQEDHMPPHDPPGVGECRWDGPLPDAWAARVKLTSRYMCEDEGSTCPMWADKEEV